MTDSRTELPPLRRKPVQERSAKRVERMLDAAAELLAEVGYDALTTTLVAKRSGVAVGSLYQFFPDKRAIVQALTHRNLERFLGAVGERFQGVDHQSWWEIVDSLLDIYLQMHREVPGFSRVHFGDAVDVQLLDSERTNNGVITDALADLVANHVDVPRDAVNLPISVAVEAADSLLKFAFRTDPEGDPQVVAETKALIKTYLASRFGD
ncbi:transcriptional regulator, TetR family [Prauserella aidingensis]|uniref:TetR family transcriptional regulator n=1 Tax=Prauserella aidingensis TaxID=387890 RepID=UPI0020A43D36|nr:TetR/AcrR family transcriptional regulator [Prauserella aidingensis]MCP2254353.1 transcriptional regulator, TetR family [Prauserella aidingensis]